MVLTSSIAFEDLDFPKKFRRSFELFIAPGYKLNVCVTLFGKPFIAEGFI